MVHDVSLFPASVAECANAAMAKHIHGVRSEQCGAMGEFVTADEGQAGFACKRESIAVDTAFFKMGQLKPRRTDFVADNFVNPKPEPVLIVSPCA